jgi:hypothetical protein
VVKEGATMAGWFDKLQAFGGAHLRHVQVLREALQMADTAAAREHLAAYLRGLSGAALKGFQASVALLLQMETQPQVQQALQWVLANSDALRRGDFRPPTPQTLPPHGLTLEQVVALVEPWAQLDEAQAEAAFVATLQALDARGRQEFAGHLETLAQRAQGQLAQMEAQDDSAWGTSFEDRMAYLQARITTGQRDPAQAQALARQRALVQALHEAAARARAWQPPATPPAPAAAQASPVPTPSPAAAGAPCTNDDAGADAGALAAFPYDGTPVEQVAALRAMLDDAAARQGMDAARRATLEDFLARIEDSLRREARRQAAAAPAPGDRAAMEADLRARMAHLSEFRAQMMRFVGLLRDVRRADAPPPGTRAAALLERIGALIEDVAAQLAHPGGMARDSEAQALQAMHLDLVRARGRLAELAADEAALRLYEADSLRATAQTLRLFHRRGHAMLARPVWPGGAARCDPGTVFVAVPEAWRPAVHAACDAAGLTQAPAARAGVDAATAQWRALQRSALAVFDLGGADPATYYALGQAYALGIELVLLARRGSVIPFDVAQHVIEVDDPGALAAPLAAALDDAVYGVQTHGLGLLMHATLARCRALAAHAVGSADADVLLSQLEATAASPLDFRAALEQFLAQLGNSRLVLLHPRWPARYPEPGVRRCFVVMPFSEQLAATQALYRRLDAELEAAGATVVRGDEALGQEIVASIWDETARASHVLVDLSGYNLNVCLELGMADAIGRDTLLIGCTGTPEARFTAIDKRRIHVYGDDEASWDGVRRQVLAFVKREPTLA